MIVPRARERGNTFVNRVYYIYDAAKRRPFLYMTLQDAVNSFSERKQLDLALALVTKALPIWHAYAEERDLMYRDTFVGLQHQIAKEILENTVNSVKEHLIMNKWVKSFSGKGNLINALGAFQEPITAIQDRDLVLPYPVERIFYAVYNLLSAIVGEKVAVSGEQTIYIAINQAADALESARILTSDQIEEVINGYK